MAAERQRKKEFPATENDAVRERLEDIDDDLLRGLHEDDRLQSSIPEEQRSTDLDFIQMSGLTRPADENDEDEGADPEDLNPTAPLNFFEAGVGDVDSSIDPVSLEGGGINDSDLVRFPDEPASVAGLREIIADLAREEDERSSPEVYETPPEAEDDYSENASSGSFETESNGFVSEDPEDEATAPDASRRTEETETAVLVEPAKPRTASAPDLAEAEAFIRELQEQPRDFDEARVRAPAPEPEPEDQTASEIEFFESYKSGDEDVSPRRRSSRRRGRLRRRLLRWMFRGILFVVVAAGAFIAWTWFERSMLRPEKAYYDAVAMSESGQHRQAAAAFSAFANQNPNHPLRPDAQFLAALQRVQDAANRPNASGEQLQRALATFQTFVAEQPNHPRASRANSLIGMVLYRLGRYDEAVEHLRSAQIVMSDPGAALPALRVLARSYAAMGDVTAARQTYLQAASMDSNVARDHDYRELGDVYRRMAESEPNPAQKKRYQREALAFWQLALNEVTMDPASRTALKTRYEMLSAETGAETSDALAARTPAPRPDSQEPVEVPAATYGKAGEIVIEQPDAGAKAQEGSAGPAE